MTSEGADPAARGTCRRAQLIAREYSRVLISDLKNFDRMQESGRQGVRLLLIAKMSYASHPRGKEIREKARSCILGTLR
jgi:hypothetical protein